MNQPALNQTELATQNIDALSLALENIKLKESDLKAQRIGLEEQIAELIECRDDGSVSIKGAMFKTTVTRGFSHTITVDQTRHLATVLPPDIFEMVIETKYAINLKELRSLRKYDAKLGQIVDENHTSKPKKTAVKIERLEA